MANKFLAFMLGNPLTLRKRTFSAIAMMVVCGLIYLWQRYIQHYHAPAFIYAYYVCLTLTIFYTSNTGRNKS